MNYKFATPMLNLQTRKKILSKGKPNSSNILWYGEPNLGSWYTDAEIDAVLKTIRESMDWNVGFGPNPKTIEEFENAFAKYCDSKYAIATNSGGTAIDMAMMCLDLKPGDEVISPAINYKSAHLAILNMGGKVVFCDIDPKTLNLDPADVEKRITPRTRAIFPVHMNGLPAPIDDLLEIAGKHPHSKYGPLKVIFDAARCCGGTYKGEKVGSKGWMSIFSFQTQKLMTTLGEGGMITTNDEALSKKLRDIRQFGGEEGWGSNYKMTKVQASVGLVQLSRLDEMNRRRRDAAKRRTKLLNGVSELVLPYEPFGSEHLYYVYSILVQPEWAGEKRDKIISIMKEKFGIVCSITNPPTYIRWPYIAKHCGNPQLPISEEIGQRLICPPLHPLLTKEQELYICAALLEAIEEVKKLSLSNKDSEKGDIQSQLKALPGVEDVNEVKIKDKIIHHLTIQSKLFGKLEVSRLEIKDARKLFNFYFKSLSEKSRIFFPPYPLLSPPPKSPQELSKRIKEWKKEKDWTFLKLSRGLQMIGVGLLKRYKTDRPTTGLAVSEKYQNKGLGIYLQAIIEEQAKLLGLKKLVNTFAPDNISSIQLHQKAGFKETGRLVPHFTYVKGVKQIDRDDIEMIKEFEYN